MSRAKLVLDTNVIIDYLDERHPHYKTTRLLMILGRMGEFDLWMSSSQVTDLVYILSDGGKEALIPSTLKKLRGLRTFVNVHALGEGEIDRMLAASWKDSEDDLLVETALAIKADCIITRNKKDFEDTLIKVMDSEEFFAWMRKDRGLGYAEIALI